MFMNDFMFTCLGSSNINKACTYYYHDYMTEAVALFHMLIFPLPTASFFVLCCEIKNRRIRSKAGFFPETKAKAE